MIIKPNGEADKTTHFHIIIILLLILVFATSFFLFYNQLIPHETEIYLSDLKSHVRTGMRGSGYSLMTTLFLLLSCFTKNKIFIAVLLALIIVFTVFATFWTMQQIIQIESVSVSNETLLLGSIALIFVCNIYFPLFYPHFYVGSCATQPWHNSTYILMRPFAVMSFGQYLKIERNYIQNIYFKDWLIFAVLLIFGNWSKPSFLIAFAPMMLFFLIYDFFKTKGKSMWQGIKFGMAVLLSLPVCLIQSMKLWGEKNNGNGVCLNTNGLVDFFTSEKYPFFFYILCGLLFPIMVTGTSFLKEKGDKKVLIQTWIIWINAFLISKCIAEYGERAVHGNFAWSRYIAGFVLYMVCFIKAVDLYKNRVIEKKIFVGLMLAFALSIGCGIIYYSIMLTGGPYLL